ncbi:MAG: hypothetical protein E6816_08470, partial [Citrobacter sp.]|nr:hypothetical protein [Citrobacter sp.]
TKSPFLVSIVNPSLPANDTTPFSVSSSWYFPFHLSLSVGIKIRPVILEQNNEGYDIHRGL